MKLQFSLATLLVCMTIAAILICACVRWPVTDIDNLRLDSWQSGKPYPIISRTPTVSEVAMRLAWTVPPAIATTIAVMWLFRRLKSRRHTEPPVG